MQMYSAFKIYFDTAAVTVSPRRIYKIAETVSLYYIIFKGFKAVTAKLYHTAAVTVSLYHAAIKGKEIPRPSAAVLLLIVYSCVTWFVVS